MLGYKKSRKINNKWWNKITCGSKRENKNEPLESGKIRELQYQHYYSIRLLQKDIVIALKVFKEAATVYKKAKDNFLVGDILK